MNLIPQSSTLKRCSQISRVAMALYYMDIILLGTGALTKTGPFSTRILFFAVALLAAVPLMLRRSGKLLKNPFLIAVLAFLLWMCVALVVGYTSGNRRDILKSDVFGFMNLLLLPAALCVLDEKRHLLALMKVIVFSTLAVALAAVVLSFFRFFPNRGVLDNFGDASGLCSFTSMGGNATRIYFHTGSRYCLVAYLLSLYFFLTSSGKKRWLWVACMAMFITGIFIAYSRAQYLGSVLAMLLTLALLLAKQKRLFLKTLTAALISLGAACLLLGGLSVLQHTNLFKVAYYRVAISAPIEGTSSEDESKQWLDYDSEVDSLTVRQEKIRLLEQSIKKHWLAGGGLGSAINYDDGYVEYTYHDIVNKMGVIGLVLFFAPFVIMAVLLFRKRGKESKPRDFLLGIVSLASIFYFLFIAYFNPCMSSTVGISCYVLTMSAFSLEFSPLDGN